MKRNSASKCICLIKNIEKGIKDLLPTDAQRNVFK